MNNSLNIDFNIDFYSTICNGINDGDGGIDVSDFTQDKNDGNVTYDGNGGDVT